MKQNPEGDSFEESCFLDVNTSESALVIWSIVKERTQSFHGDGL